ncbi:hypothetical protein EJ05DRAFT_498718 [Pseudovirgaria hyperparasitica]|uniref:Peptidase C14 caspase domain-containing protein n=1 Tax=Pseudovirgaria hyperparasitica TaxID=470096 RepID=A0A6A6WD68_9PEZI|nr:uncharacterized protein EJ05DRAFT_498718 [Pseudovirgaria hyperparasitica]KAF2759507.1 hypothetical protein EJ05DRAFT_498718 [Pseudovirgaria hyperparasitica]
MTPMSRGSAKSNNYIASSREDYGFVVVLKRLNVDSHTPQTQINYCIAEFAHNHNLKNSLLIVYYAGRANYFNEKLRMTGTAKRGVVEELVPHSMTGNSMEQSLRGLASDILVIFDCCEPGSLAHGRAARSFEYMAACGAGETAALPGSAPFTAALIKAVKGYRAEKEIFTSQHPLQSIQGSETLSKNQQPNLSTRHTRFKYRLWIAPLNADILNKT